MFENIIYDTVYHSIPIILCVIGGAFAYKANVLNIGLEGMMLSGAFFSVLAMYLTQNIVLSVVISIVASLVWGFIFSYFGVTLKGNVIVIGTAINMLMVAIAGFILQILKTSNITLSFVNVADFKINIPIIENIPVIGSLISGHTPITYISILMIFVLYALMYKTKFGIYVRVVGENEEATKSLGIKINYYKYMAVLIGAVCAGFAGINLSLERIGLFTNEMTAGRGFIAVAAIYCGKGNPLLCSIYAVVFGLARSLAVNLSIYAGAASGLFDTIPYLIMIVVLVISSVYKHKNNMSRTIKMD